MAYNPVIWAGGAVLALLPAALASRAAPEPQAAARAAAAPPALAQKSHGLTEAAQKAGAAAAAIAVPGPQGFSIIGLGFLTKDSEGEIGVTAPFDIIDRAAGSGGKAASPIHFFPAKRSGAVYRFEKTAFRLKKAKRISPVENLAFLTVEGDITEGGLRRPLALAAAPLRESLFYFSGGGAGPEAGPDLASFQLSLKPVRGALASPGRMDFLVDEEEAGWPPRAASPEETEFSRRLSLSPFASPIFQHFEPEPELRRAAGWLIINKKGEAAAFAPGGLIHVLYGVPAPALRNFLSGPPPGGSEDFQSSLFEARKTLLQKARSGSPKAQYEIIKRPLWRDFMLSAGAEGNPRLLGQEMSRFQKGSASWNPDLHYLYLISRPEKERQSGFRLLAQNPEIKNLAEQGPEGHPLFQYLAGLILLESGGSQTKAIRHQTADSRRPLQAKKPEEPAIEFLSELFFPPDTLSMEALADAEEKFKALAHDFLHPSHNKFEALEWFRKSSARGFRPAFLQAGWTLVEISLSYLIRLMAEDYPPAQLLLRLLADESLEKIEEFVSRRMEFKPLLPLPGHASRTFWERQRDMRGGNIEPAAREALVFLQSGFFGEALKLLESGLNELKRLEGYGPEYEPDRRRELFNARIIHFLRRQRAPLLEAVMDPPSDLEKKAGHVFRHYFAPKKDPKERLAARGGAAARRLGALGRKCKEAVKKSFPSN